MIEVNFVALCFLVLGAVSLQAALLIWVGVTAFRCGQQSKCEQVVTIGPSVYSTQVVNGDMPAN